MLFFGNKAGKTVALQVSDVLSGLTGVTLCRLLIQMSLEALEHGADGVRVAAEVVEGVVQAVVVA